MRLYDTSDGKFLAVGAAHSEPVKGVAFLSNNSKGKADCQMLASVSKDSTAVVWRFQDSQLTSVGLCVGHDNSVETIAARPRCDNGVVQFATGGWDRTVRLWSWPLATSSSTEETLANEEAATLDIRHAKKRRVASKSSESMDTPNSNVATADGVAKIESSESLMGHSGCITSMGWVGDDKLCTGSWDRSLRVWDMNAGVCESTVSCKRVISNLAVQPNESAVCTVHPDGKARLWDLRISEGESIVAAKTFSGHKGWVSSVSWVDERTFVTSGYDGSVVLWDMSDILAHGDDEARRFWSEFDFDGLRKSLETFADEVKESQKNSTTSRKKLAEATRDFRNLSATEKLQNVGHILRKYQGEIDSLTKRARKAETKFATAFRDIHDAPNPREIAAALTLAKAKDKERNEQSSELLEKISRYEKEFTTLKNQDVTVRLLKDKLVKSAASLEEAVSLRVSNLKRDFENARADREDEIAEQMKQSEQKLNEANIRCDDLQNRLFELQKNVDETNAGMDSQADMSSEIFERNRLRAQILERENDVLKKQIADLQANKSGKVSHSYVADAHIREEERRVMYRNMKEQIRVERAAKEELDMKLKALEAKTEKAAEAYALEASELKAELSRRPTQVEVSGLRKKIAAFQAVEFSTPLKDSDIVVEDGGVESAGGTEEQAWANALVSRKMRQLHAENAKMRARLGEVEARFEDQTKILVASEEQLADAKKLVARLEEDLARGNDGSTTRGKTPRSDLRGKNLSAPSDTTDSSIDDEASMVAILKAQRDRFRQRMANLESKEEARIREESRLRLELKQLREDNVGLYEKIRFLQSYKSQRANSQKVPSMGARVDLERGNTDMTKYEKLYKERGDPFAAFRRRELRKRYDGLSATERVALTGSKLLLANKFTRMIFFIYALALHLLVSYTLLGHAHTCHEFIK
eukprot:g4689.t1